MIANRHGFSLMELIIAIAIIGILLSIASLNFNQMTRKSNVEKATRELYSDLNEARLQSVFTKKRHSIIFETGNRYIMKQYSSLNEAEANGITKKTTNTSYLMTNTDGSALTADLRIIFDIRGYTSNVNTIRFNPVDIAAFDCVVISEARTNLGKMGTGNVCAQK